MPVYNTGEILSETILSILNQTYTDFELLLIDDGSSDGSDKICDDFSVKDKRVKTFHKKNGGICDARNFGLSKATGHYIAFCDHDDLFEPDLLKKAYTAAVKYNANVVKFKFKAICETKSFILPHSISDEIIIYDISSVIYELNKCFTSVWSFIYDAKWLKSTSVYFDTRFKHGGEDYDFNMHLIPYIKCMVIIPDILYMHIVRENLSTSAKMYEDIMLNFLDSQYLLEHTAEKIGCKLSNHKLAYIKCYGQSVLNFISGAIKLNKNNDFIVTKLLDFRRTNKVYYKQNIFIVCKSLFINRKETIFYLLSDLKLYNLLIFLFRIYKMIAVKMFIKAKSLK